MWVIGQSISVLTKSTLPEKGTPESFMPDSMALSQSRFFQ